MLNSLNAGVSGLQQFKSQIDLIGNNIANVNTTGFKSCLLYTSPSPRDQRGSRMPSSA